jgi:hypothetical protein
LPKSNKSKKTLAIELNSNGVAERVWANGDLLDAALVRASCRLFTNVEGIRDIELDQGRQGRKS